jgi:hypothetical protein
MSRVRAKMRAPATRPPRPSHPWLSMASARRGTPHMLPDRAILAAAAGAVGLGTAALIATPTSTPSELITAQQITVSRPPIQIPWSDPQLLALLDRKPDYGPLADPHRRASCLAGLGYPVAAQILGAQPIEIAGRAAVLLLLSGDTSGTVTVLAVAPTCSSLNTGRVADRVVNRP